jgi:thiol-disulfide isomerase/thioredoxin
MSKRKPTGASTPRGARSVSRAAAAQRAQARWRWINRGLAAAGVAAVLAIIAVALASSGKGSSAGAGIKEGAAAPEGSFTTTQGATRTIASLSGQPTLLWFVTTWCSSCQAGTQAMASEIVGRLAERHVRVVEVENAEDLGQAGPSMPSFVSQLAGPQARNPDWTFGVASSALTKTYNPEGSLDIYYLLDAGRRIAYINSSPAATKAQLLREAEKVSSQ